MTHIEALDLQRRPDHLIVLGGGYVGLELSQALRRLGSRVTLITRSAQLVSNEDADVSQAILQLFRDEGIDVMLGAQVLQCQRPFRAPPSVFSSKSGTAHEPWREPTFSSRLDVRPTQAASDWRRPESRSPKRGTSA